nr:phosphatidate cytidylyltransferase [Dysgonomonas sp. 216]
MITRILTGIVFVAVLLGSILYNQYTFAIVLGTIQILALIEFYGLLSNNAGVKTSKYLNIVGGFLLFAGAFLYFSGVESSLIVVVPYILYLLILFASELYLKRANPLESLAYSLLGQIYVALPYALLSYMAFGYESGVYHSVYILGLFLFIWVNDSFAYLFGVTLGKHRMFERISPKKSWEGFIGGAVSAIIASVIFGHYFTGLSLCQWIGYASVVVAAGTLGDLIESLFKRTIKVKDSGKMLPGHGGVLDRFDSMIFAIPALFVYLEAVKFFS